MTTNNKNFQELKYLKNWSLTILDFLSKKNGDYKLFAEASKVSLEKYPTKPNTQMVKGLRDGFRDFNEMAKNLPAADYEELNVILSNKFGKNLIQINNESMILKIIKRGIIKSDMEYRIVEERVNDLSQNDSKSSEIITLNNLLSKYYQSSK